MDGWIGVRLPPPVALTARPKERGLPDPTGSITFRAAFQTNWLALIDSFPHTSLGLLEAIRESS